VKPELTIAEAAKLTGLSKQALRRRIERKSLPATRRNGLRIVRAQDLAEAGLLDLLTGGPPTMRAEKVDAQAVARELVQTVIRQGIELHNLTQRLEELEAATRAGHEAQQEELDQARRERRALQKQVRELRSSS
jgi:excisionase family DNA binding protein